MLDSEGLLPHLQSTGLATEVAGVLAATPVPLPACAAASAMPAEAEAGWWHIFGLLNRSRLEEEVAIARRDFAERADIASQRRLLALVGAQNNLTRDQGEAEIT